MADVNVSQGGSKLRDFVKTRRGKVLDPGFLLYLKGQEKSRASGLYDYESGEVISKDLPTWKGHTDPPGSLPVFTGQDMWKLHEEWANKEGIDNPYRGPGGQFDFEKLKDFRSDMRVLGSFHADYPENAWNMMVDGQPNPRTQGWEFEVSQFDIDVALKAQSI